MRCRTGRAAALLLLALPGAAAAPPVPLSVSASYNVLRNGGHVAVMHETFEASGSSYRIVSETHAVGLLALFAPRPLRVTSSGWLTGAGLTPQYYEHKRGEDDPRRIRAEFDWEEAQLKVRRSGRSETLPLPPGTQDQLSIMYQFMYLAPDRPQLLQLSRTNGRRLEQHRYTVRAGVEIETALGPMTTVHLVRQHHPEESGVEIWLAPQKHYLPVRLLVLEDGGARFEQVITKLETKP
ncbi:MAG TPA: DUF3108 domain-containing protein [Burkholderiales bacterium]|jgi:hypothetical protein